MEGENPKVKESMKRESKEKSGIMKRGRPGKRMQKGSEVVLRQWNMRMYNVKVIILSTAFNLWSSM